MCGIVGYIGSRNAEEVLVSGLEKLEYRGYDSAGIAVFENESLEVHRALGKLVELKRILAEHERKHSPSIGIGHTRWATHGRPSAINAHPHTAGRVSLIHNGIIENYVDLRSELEKDGRVFSSETDTEIAAHLLDRHLQSGEDPLDALKNTCKQLRGSFAFLALDSAHKDQILVAKNSTPIVIGIGEDETFVASDITALLQYTRDVIILEDGDVALVKRNSVYIEHGGKEVARETQHITWDPVTAQKGGFKHFMLKEIHEQVVVSAETFRGRVHLEKPSIDLSEVGLTEDEVKSIDRIILIACGTAWHACLLTKFYIEKLAGIPCEVDYASEYRYRDPIFDKKTLVVAISQSGETADTLGALELVRNTANTLAICNVVGSTMTRRVNHVLYTHAGPEISVASTKAFTTQLVAGYLLAAFLGEKRGTLKPADVATVVNDLVLLPTALDEALSSKAIMAEVGREYHKARGFLFIGRGTSYPIALEGALKLKEISYIHAEGYPAGEMKHGPIALIDEEMPVVVALQRSDVLFEKTLSNLKEVESRGGNIIAVTDTQGHKELEDIATAVVEVPHISELLSPIVLNIPLQFLAYYVAIANGTDVDLPRNLAKSVTVE